jgi:hypothetical protein
MVYIESLIISNDKPLDPLEEGSNEENLPAQQSPEKKDAWLLRTEELEEWTERS